VLNNKSHEDFRNLKFGDRVLIPSKSFFDGEEPVVLILKDT
jgi:hypothetical protein